jgi:arsenate reductase (glutaredoxin)
MANGIVKFFNSAKGFGFITPEGGGKDVFIPATSIASSGVSNLKAGQLVSFETEPDSKGPKAVQLKILAEPPKQAPRESPRESLRELPRDVKERPAPATSTRLTVYLDPASDDAQTVLATLQDLGQEPRVVDYIATPPTRDELRNLSMLLRDADQSLARRYDTLFLALQLDDRFISENEFWTAIVEHPSLINGPVLVNASKARICRTENAVRSFLGLEAASEPRAAKPKTVPEVKAPPEKEKAKKPAEKTEAKAAVREKPPAPKKPEPKAKAKAAPKAAAKPTKPAKKAVPAKKTKRA